MKKFCVVISFLFCSCSCIKNNQPKDIFVCSIADIADVVTLFPSTVKQVETRTAVLKTKILDDTQTILDISAESRTFANTMQAYDTLLRTAKRLMAPLEVLNEVSPDAAVRQACFDALLELNPFVQKHVLQNKDLFKAIQTYIDGNSKTEVLDDEQQYFNQELMRDFKRNGMLLPDDRLAAVIALTNKISELSLQFDKNISSDATRVACSEAELEGVPASVLEHLAKDGQGNFLVTMDYPTAKTVIKFARNSQTRKRVHEAFNNRAYPANYKLLDEIITLRDQKAKMLGFPDFASYDLDSEMAKQPQAVEAFLGELRPKLERKRAQEFNAWLGDLPQGITLAADGVLQPWDVAYVKEYYKQKHLQLNDQLLSEYFPVDHVIDAICAIYQQFLGLRFERVTCAGLWHESVYCFAVYDTDAGRLRGYLLFDLYPRPNKYSHACMIDVVSAQKEGDVLCPAVIAIIANFPHATTDRPGLLKFADVETFFHEFGHAMHGMVGATRMFSFSGTSVKRDFVEMPSQMFEQWVKEPGILKKLSKHYRSGQPLSDDMIATLGAIDRFDAGLFMLDQLGKTLLSLRLHAEGKKDIQRVYVDIMRSVDEPYIAWDDAVHLPANFGHLTGYAAKYYSYLWSKVFALDLFSAIKEQGLINPAVGKKFVDQVLGKGGAVDPELLLERFLGRKPTVDALLKQFGLAD